MIFQCWGLDYKWIKHWCSVGPTDAGSHTLMQFGSHTDWSWVMKWRQWKCWLPECFYSPLKCTNGIQRIQYHSCDYSSTRMIAGSRSPAARQYKVILKRPSHSGSPSNDCAMQTYTHVNKSCHNTKRLSTGASKWLLLACKAQEDCMSTWDSVSKLSWLYFNILAFALVTCWQGVLHTPWC